MFSIQIISSTGEERKKDWSCAKEEKINLLAMVDFVIMKHLSHEMDADTTQQNINTVFL